MSDVPRRFGGGADARLDRAIDRAVRDIMRVDPRPGFRSRVLAHLDREPVRSTMFARFAVSAGALAVLLLAVMVMVSDRRSELPQGAAQRATPPSTRAPREAPVLPPPVAATNAAPPKTAARPGQGGRRSVREAIPIPRVANVFGQRGRGVAATTVDADTLWPAKPADTPREDHPDAPPALVIPPLEPAPPIVIPPLNPRGPGGGL